MQKYLVGGAVRDRLLSLPVHERDWVVVGSTPQEMISLGFRQVGKDFPVFLHPQSAEEYALARTERKSGKGHKGFQVFSSPDITLEEDLLRRDLTINAIAQDEHGNLTDPYDGIADIKNRILRHISPAFSEDPLRVLRVARFAARFWHLGFTIDSSTLELMSTISHGDELMQLSKERIWQETKRALDTAHPDIYLLILLHVDALVKIAPSLNNALKAKTALMRLPALRKLNDYEVKYTALVMLASEQEGTFNTQIANDINQHFACPNSLQELATLTNQYFTDCNNALSRSSEDIYKLLQQLDAFRREARCLYVLNCMESMIDLFDFTPSPSLNFLQNIVPQLNAVKLSSQQQKNLAGKEIGDALTMLRTKVIKQAMKN